MNRTVLGLILPVGLLQAVILYGASRPIAASAGSAESFYTTASADATVGAPGDFPAAAAGLVARGAMAAARTPAVRGFVSGIAASLVANELSRAAHRNGGRSEYNQAAILRSDVLFDF
jgi:hypothetical protein